MSLCERKEDPLVVKVLDVAGSSTPMTYSDAFTTFWMASCCERWCCCGAGISDILVPQCLGSSVGRALAFESQGSGFDTRHRQLSV